MPIRQQRSLDQTLTEAAGPQTWCQSVIWSTWFLSTFTGTKLYSWRQNQCGAKISWSFTTVELWCFF